MRGSLPAGLEGVLFRNGPGLFSVGGVRYRHPFDGDGHIARIAIGRDGVRYTNRFVRTAEFVAEQRAGRMLYRSFGTNLPGGMPANLLRMRFKNAANTNVVWHGGRLLALWEGGLPHRLDPRTLTTMGPEDFQGRLRNPFSAPGRWLSPTLPFSAHPRIDAETGELINFGLVFGAKNRLLVYRVDADGCMAPPEPHDLPRFSFVHDMAVTRKWLCLLLPHADFDIPRALFGLRTPVGALQLATHRPMQALLIPRAGGEARLIDAVPGFVFHIAQGFDQADGTLALDLARFEDYPAFDDLETLFRSAETGHDSLPRLERLIIDPRSGRCETHRWSERGAELPTTVPGALGEPRRFVWSLGAPATRGCPYFTALQRLDTETGMLAVRDFGRDLVGEPIVVGTGGGSDGAARWVLGIVHRSASAKTELLVLRADDFTDVAAIELPHALPPGFHGCWAPRAAVGER
ncbi:MAG: carotenoid oxygenase family protein [Thiohalocapsa sp.]|nr:carotenoid oxygenase family protein [Thiohalocapsa sp.]